jgi:hypothetical protein
MFSIAPTIQIRSTTTNLHESLSVEEREPMIKRWGEIRAMTQEEADAQLKGEELEAYNRYYKEMREGVLSMKALAELMMKDVEPPRIKPKSKSQRKRDRFLREQAYEHIEAGVF